MKNPTNLKKVMVLLLCTIAFTQVFAQNIDKAYADLIKKHTTDERFLPRSMQTFPASSILPSPLEHFGTIIGAPGVMHHTKDIYNYYKILASKSDRMEMVTITNSEEGRPIHLLIISSPENLKNLETYKQNLNKLADPRTIKENEVESLVLKTKPMYYLNGGLHSTEMGSPEMLMELVFRLLAEESSEMDNIRDNVITLINPVSEPDGRDKQVDWYYRYTKSKKEFDDGMRGSSPYWGKYVFHDNNRDGLQVSQALTKAIFDVFYEYHPVGMLDLHESVALLYISTGTGPYNTYIDPITIGEWQVMGNHDLTQVTAEGLPGVFTWAFYNGWWPGYGIWVANNHNATGRFYETFGNGGGNTFMRDLSNTRYAGDPVHSRQWYRPVPPTEKVLWSSRNNINYMQSGVVASLSYAANNGNQLLKNFYQKGVNNINKWKHGGKYAYVISKDQRDPNMTAYLVNQLRVQGIDVHLRNKGDNKGEYVVLLNQPYSGFADALLSKQNYPKTAKHNPYDDIAWTYGLMYGVDVKTVAKADGFSTSNLELLTEDVSVKGSDSGSGSNLIINYKAQNEVLPLLYKVASSSKEAKINITTKPITVKKKPLGSGSIIISGADKNTVNLIKDMGLDVVKASSVSNESTKTIKLPRIAIYHTWYNTQAEGWARFTFENRSIPYTSIDKDDLKNGNLNNRFDVVLIPHTSGNVETMIHGIDTKWGPMPYTKTDEFPHHGYPDATDDMTGGPGFDGMDNLKKFVENGGTLITLANATRMAAETGITRELTPLSTGNLYHPGSLVTTKVRNKGHHIMNGYPEITHVFRGNLQMYQVGKYQRDHMVMQYGTSQLKDEKVYEGEIMGMVDYKPDSIAVAKSKEKSKHKYVLSGMVKNEDKIVGQGAIFDIPVGKGHVVAFTFNPLHRYLNHHDAPMLWNAIINWDVKPKE
ncbi:M14 family zinc carboxypeptidase [Pontimicrobium sp. SW4]|uniref:M14 family zinc carboxypeptidase n=1 Tax=Pontimicrobium sp. SW4 TaxID=3153519 RepID=A0AAU7BTP0_9FLAO